MKTVGSNKEAAAAFAAGATNFTNSRRTFFVSGDVVYSYGENFPPIASRVQGAVLFTAHDYSHTTSAYKTEVWRAVISAGLPVFTVDHVLVDEGVHNRNLEGYVRRLKTLCVTSWKKRTASTLQPVVSEFFSTWKEAQKYRERFLPEHEDVFLSNPNMFVLKLLT